MSPRQREVSKIPTKIPQPRRAGRRRTPGRAVGLIQGTGRVTPTGRPVIETAEGITVYPARRDGGRWRAVWYENGERAQCQAASEEALAERLGKVAGRLAADGPGLLRPGSDLVAWYLSADRLPAERRWSRRHAETQPALRRRPRGEHPV